MYPSRALGWYIWARHRRGLTLFGGGLALIFLARLACVGEIPFVPMVLAALFGVFAFPYLLGIFSLSLDAQLELGQSGFPARLWKLPLPARALIGWPMLGGVLSVSLLWLVLAAGIFRAVDSNVPLIWPGFLFAVVLAWMQALVWSPFPFAWLRIVAVVLLLNAAAVVTGCLAALDIAWPIWTAAFTGLLALAYGVALAGVRGARCGEGPRWTWPTWLRRNRALAPRILPPFPAPAHAQLWLEWRRRGLAFPIVVLGCLVFCLPLISPIASTIEQAAQSDVDGRLVREVGSLWLVVGAFLFVPQLFAPMCAPEMGKMGGQKRTMNLSAFLAARPITCWDMVSAKFRMAARSTLLGWVLTAAGLLLWFAFGGKAAAMREAFASLGQRYSAVSIGTTLCLLVAGAVLLTWLQMIKWLWLGLSGRAWLMPLAVWFFFEPLVWINLGVRLERWPMYWEQGQDFLPWLAGGVVLLKALSAVWCVHALLRRRLMPRRVLAGLLAGWGVLVVGLFAVLSWLVPRVWLPASVLVLGLALLMPLTRLLVTPLALAWNRHR